MPTGARSAGRGGGRRLRRLDARLVPVFALALVLAHRFAAVLGLLLGCRRFFFVDLEVGGGGFGAGLAEHHADLVPAVAVGAAVDDLALEAAGPKIGAVEAHLDE